MLNKKWPLNRLFFIFILIKPSYMNYEGVIKVKVIKYEKETLKESFLEICSCTGK